MLLTEIKRFCLGPYALVALGLTVLFFVGGYEWTVPSNPDGVDELMCLRGVYTVYCQFGQLILSAFAMHYITSDYTGCTILFYRSMGCGSLSYYACKVLVMVGAFAISYAVCLLVVCGLYGGMSPWLPFALQTASLLLAYISVCSAVALAVGSFVPAFFSYVVWWLAASLVIANGEKWTQWLQLFDQNAPVYRTTVEHMANAATFAVDQMGTVLQCAAYALALFAAGAIVARLAGKRWLHHGV